MVESHTVSCSNRWRPLFLMVSCCLVSAMGCHLPILLVAMEPSNSLFRERNMAVRIESINVGSLQELQGLVKVICWKFESAGAFSVIGNSTCQIQTLHSKNFSKTVNTYITLVMSICWFVYSIAVLSFSYIIAIQPTGQQVLSPHHSPQKESWNPLATPFFFLERRQLARYVQNSWFMHCRVM